MIFPSFKIKEFRFPEFSLTAGKMVRFWVQIIPELEKDTNGYWAAHKMHEYIDKLNGLSNTEKIYLCPNKLKFGFFSKFKKTTIASYLSSIFGEKIESILESLDGLGIKPEFSLNKLGTAHHKVLSIVCGIEKNNIVVFDFYAISPDTEKALMEYIHAKLEEGKSLIAFDNLMYQCKILDEQSIENIIVKRKRE